jgi:hypothetical protein
MDRHLEALPSQPVPPPPKGEKLVSGVRRPGELHEVLHLGDKIELVIAAKANAARIDFDVATTLLLELRLLVDDLSCSDYPLIDAPLVTQPRRRLSAAEAAYLRTLTFRAAIGVPSAPRAAVPVRLLPRINSQVLATFVSGELEQAIAWETAAVISGRTIGELGVLIALQTSNAA